MAIAHVCREWMESYSSREKRQLCDKHLVSYSKMQNVMMTRNQLLQSLASIGFLSEGKNSQELQKLNENSGIGRIVRAGICAGLYGNVVKVKHPEKRYQDSLGGKMIEKKHEARAIQFFCSPPDLMEKMPPPPGKNGFQPRYDLERVFLHPSSVNFATVLYESPWMVFSEKVNTSKIFVRESSMVSPYALLLFGGQVAVHHESGTVAIDDWIRFSAVARVAVLIQKLRFGLDKVLSAKIGDPTVDMTELAVTDVVCKLLSSDGFL